MVKEKKQRSEKRRGAVSLSGEVAPGERSPLVALRFPPDQLEQIDTEAEKHGLGRSAMVRRLVTVGLQFIGKIKAGK